MPDTGHILIVDDEIALLSMLQPYLAKHGFTVSVATDGDAMWQVLAEHDIDLIILDIRMPGEDGLALAGRLRARGNTAGILFLTASGETVDRIVGLELGGDDYMPKPFDPRELLARVRSVLRRRPPAAAPAPTTGAEAEVRFGRCVLNLRTRQLCALDGEDVPLTTMEFDMLQAFAASPDKVLTRGELLGLAHKTWDPADRSIDIRVGRLRKKIEADPDKPSVIKTVRAIGYIFVTRRGEMD